MEGHNRPEDNPFEYVAAVVDSAFALPPLQLPHRDRFDLSKTSRVFNGAAGTHGFENRFPNKNNNNINHYSFQRDSTHRSIDLWQHARMVLKIEFGKILMDAK